jgi:secondary thiamine-phosphate synthase enzyme
VLHAFTVTTEQRRQFVDITRQVEAELTKSGIQDGICLVYSPHTTAAITINENADPDVVTDLLRAYADVVGDERRFRHAEGNSGAHALTSLVGPSVALPVQHGLMVLGQWQAIYLCEFDGPRERTVQVHILGEARGQLEHGSRGGPS